VGLQKPVPSHGHGKRILSPMGLGVESRVCLLIV
jgi:hypothetical protein